MAHPNRWPLHSCEDKEFKKALEMMRPGVGGKLLHRKKLAGSQLDKEHNKIDADMRSSLQVCCSIYSSIYSNTDFLSSC